MLVLEHTCNHDFACKFILVNRIIVSMKLSETHSLLEMIENGEYSMSLILIFSRSIVSTAKSGLNDNPVLRREYYK